MALKGWKEIPIGGVIDEPGKSREVKTGSWRVMRPIVDHEKCTNCMQCWLFCPDFSIKVEINEKGRPIMAGINYDYCKGCGVCASVCPVNAIEMKPETEFVGE